MSRHRVADLSLAPAGVERIAWAESWMPVMMAMRAQLRDSLPLRGERIAGSSTITAETAAFLRTLRALGAEISWCASNPLTTHDDVAAALAEEGVPIFAWKHMRPAEYYGAIEEALLHHADGPTLAVDEGADLIVALHERHPLLASHVRGGTDKTTTGVERLRAMAAAGALRFPVLAVNDALTKWEYDNVYGTGQSTIDGILRATGVLLAGKTFVVGGFGHVGRGVALRARGMGADVIITEVRPTSALIAAMEGYRVLPMDEAAALGDIFCTASGMRDLIVARHLAVMKDGAILCNAGHFDCEINLGDLRSLARATRRVREHVERFELDDARSVYLLGEGRVVNLAAADGNPSEIMDLTFATHLLALLELARDAVALDIGVHRLPSELDERIARLKLETLGLRTDSLSAAQVHYDEDFSSTSRLPSASSL